MDNAFKVSLILAAALGTSVVLRGRSAALRHWLLSAALMSALAVPALALLVPGWRLQVAPIVPDRALVDTRHVDGAAPGAPPAAAAAVSGTTRASLSRSGSGGSDQARAWLRAIWIAGVVCSLLILAAGFVRLARLAAAATPLEDTRWRTELRRLASEYGIKRPIRLLATDHPALLVTWGFMRPVVLVPSTAIQWSADRIRVVLAHELAHIHRHDWIVMVIADVLRAVYWFNPLAILMSRRVRWESECACDDAVLSQGEDAPGYATHLLDVARAFRSAPTTRLPAPAMVRASSLERRIGAMLNPRVHRGPIGRRARFTIGLVALAMTGGVAAFQAQTFTTLSGSIVDSTNRPLAGAAVVLTTGPNQEKREIKSDATGHFELDGLPPAEYRLEVWAAGFGPFAETVSLGARPVQRVVRLEVGSLTETVTVYEAAPPVSQPATEPREYTLPPCVSGAVGGHINQPLKLADKRPIYPTAAHSAGQVHVRLEGRIGTDGYFQELKVASPTQPEFDAAAVEAVRQWRFSQTRLNCVPIDVPMTVHVSFVPKP